MKISSLSRRCTISIARLRAAVTRPRVVILVSISTYGIPKRQLRIDLRQVMIEMWLMCSRKRKSLKMKNVYAVQICHLYPRTFTRQKSNKKSWNLWGDSNLSKEKTMSRLSIVERGLSKSIRKPKKSSYASCYTNQLIDLLISSNLCNNCIRNGNQ